MSPRTLCIAGGLMVLALAMSRTGEGRGFGGGGGGRVGGGGGGFHGGGGGFPQAAPRPSVGHYGGGGYSLRPSVNRPTAARPSQPISRPSGGFKPSTSQPSYSANRPVMRPLTPGSSSSHPAGSTPHVGTWPSSSSKMVTLPSSPNIGGGNLSGATTRPAFPNRPDVGNLRPGGPGPSPGNVGDFLGIQKPLGPSTLPGQIGTGGITNRPGAGGGGIRTLPGGITNRPGAGGGGIQTLPGGIANRPGAGGGGIQHHPNRPWEPGQRPNIGPNHNINNRPSWVHIGDTNINNIHANWGNAIGNRNMGSWINNHPDRYNHWNNWANNVHNNWRYGNNWFNHDWWNNHYHPCAGWHYWHNFGYRPWGYWWGVPAWSALTSWFTWPTTGWSDPIYYDYGQGGNVVYDNSMVYINGQQVATADEFAQSAAALATVPPPASEELAAQSQWMALGTFAMSMGQTDTSPARVIQLAVNKEGIVSGTFYNADTDQTTTIQGQVDKQTQRVAFRIGESDTVVAETGLYDLTQPQAPLLMHFGPNKTETYLLVRLEAPPDQQS